MAITVSVLPPADITVTTDGMGRSYAVVPDEMARLLRTAFPPAPHRGYRAGPVEITAPRMSDHCVDEATGSPGCVSSTVRRPHRATTTSRWSILAGAPASPRTRATQTGSSGTRTGCSLPTAPPWTSSTSTT
jgi:hypothetical protein